MEGKVSASDLWTIIPFLDLPEMTSEAIDDVLAQWGVRTRVLAISNPSSPDTRKHMEARGREPRWRERVLFWWHHPPLETLDATWNAALDFVWATGAERAWVVNNDVRFHESTARLLDEALSSSEALFVSAVGVRPAMPEPYRWDLSMRGGPDFSCFFITRECHEKYPFDEGFTYTGDCDLHRQMMLGGDGARIFSVDVPYLHLASQTIKRASPERQAYFAEQSRLHHERYRAKWGGDVNGERFRAPFDPGSAEDGITNPELQARG